MFLCRQFGLPCQAATVISNKTLSWCAEVSDHYDLPNILLTLLISSTFSWKGFELGWRTACLDCRGVRLAVTVLSLAVEFGERRERNKEVLRVRVSINLLVTDILIVFFDHFFASSFSRSLFLDTKDFKRKFLFLDALLALSFPWISNYLILWKQHSV